MHEQERLRLGPYQAPAPPATVLTAQAGQDLPRSVASGVAVTHAVLTLLAPLREEGKEWQRWALLPQCFVTSRTWGT
ncbi:hypothetical protein EU556_24810 [Hymenobacter fodinae]|uniref:Uncharacterized protein n=1 Tax=Hymenobacter fodinae TaxID=2510796 RepID=A0A4Z0NZ58_9BACT|nr:hypothetical protein EU556_24810 [Hymenobacter fodinae]